MLILERSEDNSHEHKWVKIKSSNTACCHLLFSLNTVFLLGAGYHKYQCQLDLYNIRLNDSKVRLFLKIINALGLHSIIIYNSIFNKIYALRMVALYFNR
jgi:hypothetical protein